jgi:hypothetical protein
MKHSILLAALLAASGLAIADTYVQGYVKKDGTYVAPHYRSSPDSTTLNNWSTQGNSNPYTGQAGTKQPSYNSYSDNFNNSTNTNRCRYVGTQIVC